MADIRVNIVPLRAFIEKYKDGGSEKSEAQTFWLTMLKDVFGCPDGFIDFERRVKIDGRTKYIDGYIPSTKVLIEHKDGKIELWKTTDHSEGKITPFQQAKNYANAMGSDEYPRWIVTCNFREIWVYDMRKSGFPEPEMIRVEDLVKQHNRLFFLVDYDSDNTTLQKDISTKAAEEIGGIFEHFRGKKDYDINELNILCVRLVFCLYCEDTPAFGLRDLFLKYLRELKPYQVREGLLRLFDVLNTPSVERGKGNEYWAEENPTLSLFPYVNGGLFEQKIDVPMFDEESFGMLLNASAKLDWSPIDPTIFGAMFESRLDPTTRHDGGMHFTQKDNIHKVIDPLFLDDLREEYNDIIQINIVNERIDALKVFQEKIGLLRFLDPACGSGNFLTETYLSLRKIENEVLRELADMGVGGLGIKVTVDNFYGIEINDYAVSVARVALWIAEHQMLEKTRFVLKDLPDFFPLKSYPHIIKQNALRIDWREVVEGVDYVMGNPPFLGGMMMNKTQKEELWDVIGKDVWGVGEMDYVVSWYYKAAEYIQGTRVQCGFVSTNSLCQGQQAVAVWKPLIEKGIKINFGHHTFKWYSESTDMAAVHVIIVGFAMFDRDEKVIFDGDQQTKVNNINSYLVDAPDVLIENRSKPLCEVPPMKFGSMPRDGGGFILTEEEKDFFIKKDPKTEKWIHLYLGSEEFINDKKRYCLWLIDAKPNDIASMPLIKERVVKVREFRLASKAEATRKFGDTPNVFCQIAQPNCDYLLIPSVSSEKREYVPMGFLTADVIASNASQIIPGATLYHFAVLTSSVHMAWMRAICGRLEMRYRYSKDIVYNNFPWAEVNEEQKGKIEKCGQGILDARSEYPDSSLATLYDDAMMPASLRKAHRENDVAVMEAYGFNEGMSEGEIVAELMKMYNDIVNRGK